jgi:hypothetical protein
MLSNTFNRWPREHSLTFVVSLAGWRIPMRLLGIRADRLPAFHREYQQLLYALTYPFRLYACLVKVLSHVCFFVLSVLHKHL